MNLTIRESNRFALFARCVAGGVLTFAATAKAQSFVSLHQGSIGLVVYSTIVLVAIELILAGWLTFGGRPVAIRAVSIAVFLLFASTSLFRALAGEANCGCFGNVRVSPWITFGLDVAIASMLIVSRGSSQREPNLAPGILRNATAVQFAFLLMMVGFGWFGSDYGGFGQSRNEYGITSATVGQPFPYFSRVQVRADMREGDWLVVFYNVGCSKCHAILSELDGEKGREFEASRIRVAIVSVSVDSSTRPPDDETDNLPFVVCVTIQADAIWEIPTPTVVWMKDGIVQAVGDNLTSVKHATNPVNLASL